MVDVARAPYGRRSSEALGEVPPSSPPPTYYGLPAVKRSHYGWLIATYFFVGGLSGSAQVLATLADRAGERSIVRAGRYLALLGSLISPILLIRDLHTSSRWYNMLRIFRPTSPMSIGSWTLAGFGTLSGLLSVCQALDDVGLRPFRRIGRVLGVPAAGLGALMSVYTGVLLSATSTPLWAATSRHLPALFGATAGASAGAALSLVLALGGAPGTVLRRLDRFGLLASAAQLALAVSTDRQWRRAGVSGPLDEAPLGAAHRVGVLALGIGLPLLVQAVHILGGRHSRSLGLLASLATLGGAYAERAVIVFGGNRSADRPEDTFRLAQKAQ